MSTYERIPPHTFNLLCDLMSAIDTCFEGDLAATENAPSRDIADALLGRNAGAFELCNLANLANASRAIRVQMLDQAMADLEVITGHRGPYMRAPEDFQP